ncbi:MULTISPECIES: ACT domain-containing protein [Brevundimonas]|jgi:acetolactate synthase-1/3 small subunit|uniref:ACT domain-containing protein n=3 Tax=Brevundimonas TaxID=41275 RepID=A0A1Z3UA94_BREVE|nr:MULTISPECIES: ACT domain-containing protein [Brevundimonas]HET9510744.1 ACT domain-containing protein [Sphingomonas sp.]ASE40213.1 acetolactate synthase 3 regulatory subunit domain protein [Brevundimonas vesicularis]KIC59647.1 acetolactate synthase 3 regulatory subunit domain protein [Brevundimonas nasdae]KJV42425.1 acetolactate synthase 3 regulatory subunit domain protein [Brevundimonas sp. KM4]KQR61151.1 acetolactate synthase 3 regulatory subunit domain protein [Brevundimonas sp. Leaf168]
MSNTIHIQIDRADGSLQRLIGLVERRGFHIDGMALADEGAFRRIALTVRGRDAGRCMDNLGRQIDRLFGVRRISNDIIQSEAA